MNIKGKIVAITQARVGSTRLPAKILKKVSGYELLYIHLKRLLQATTIDELIVATTYEERVDEIIDICKRLGVQYFQGSTDDVLDRFYQAVKDENAKYVVRLTSDCPLIDPRLVDEIVTKTIEQDVDYCSNVLTPTYPDGESVEVFKFESLKKAWSEAALKSEREHVTPYIWKNSTHKNKNLFTSYSYKNSEDYSKLRMTLDTQEDLQVLERLIEVHGIDLPWRIYAEELKNNIELQQVNCMFNRDDGYNKSINNDAKK